VKLEWVAGVVVVAALGVLGTLALDGGDDIDAAAAEQVARDWTGIERTDPARRRENGWEVDVHRDNGSVIEVNLGPKLELVELDEELGPGGTPASDEVLGAERERVIAAVRREGVSGFVRSVEREPDGSIEVDVVRTDRTILEVDLDARLRLLDTEREELGDE
jgi:hypothetical protein